MRKQSGVEQKASLAAMWTNICRVMANRESHPKFRGPDDMSDIFISPFKNYVLGFDFIRAFIRKKLTPACMRI